MEPIHSKQFWVEALHCDRFDRCKPSALLYFVQEASGEHCQILNIGMEQLQQKHLFWAILRHRLQVTRLPRKGERITVETWPMPTTRTAYPRSVIARDETGQELFRSIGLWVLMDPDTRALVLPAGSGVEVAGILRGTELTVPGALIPGALGDSCQRTVAFTDLDINGHMNNGRYLDWICDLLPSGFHQANPPRELTLCYQAEAREGDVLRLQWILHPDGRLQVDIFREAHRVFAASIAFGSPM